MNARLHMSLPALLAAALLVTPPAAGQTRSRDAAQARSRDQVPLIPRQLLFGSPDRQLVRISPDATRLSYLAPHQTTTGIWIEKLDGTGTRVVADAAAGPISDYFWAWNGEQIVYTQRRSGSGQRLYAADVDGTGETDLTPHEGVSARLIAADPALPDEILVAMNRRSPQTHDVYRVNTRSGEAALMFQNDRNFATMIADGDFEIRAATRFEPDGGATGFLRDDAASPWYELAEWEPQDSGISGTLAFSRDGRTLYVLDSRRRDTGALHAFTIGGRDGDGRDTGDPTYELLAQQPRADAGPVVFHPVTGRPQAVAFEYDRRSWKVLDTTLNVDWMYLRTVGHGDLALESRDREDRTWIVSFVRDDGPTEYYLYDRGAQRAEFLFTNRSRLAGLPLAAMRAVTIPARDGLPLVSYLTRPVSGRQSDLPMVLLVHGGPWARDRWGYNPIHQWLANRGYAVLSVNYRGSSGFGKSFLNAGRQEWAGTMQDDLIDAVNWAVAQGVADPDRVAIMGGSYGGYAALVGLSFTPEFFAAGVDIVGPMNVRTLIESIPAQWQPIRALFEERVGSLENPGILESISPVNRADAIVRPLLIGHGGQDPRVRDEECRRVVDSMLSRGVPVTWVVFPDEGHGFARPENNLAFFGLAESFLATHLGGRAEPFGDALQASSAEIRAGAGLIGLATD